MAALRAEDTEEMSILQVALDKAQRQAAVPPVDHQIKATEDFIERAKKRLLRHDVVVNEAQEALQKAESMKSAEAKSLAEAEELLQRLRVQVPEVPLVPRSVQELEKLVEQLQSERWVGKSVEEPKFDEIGGDGSLCRVPKKQRNSCWNDPPNGEQLEKTFRQTSRISHAGWSRGNWSCEMLSRWATLGSSRSCPS